MSAFQNLLLGANSRGRNARYGKDAENKYTRVWEATAYSREQTKLQSSKIPHSGKLAKSLKSFPVSLNRVQREEGEWGSRGRSWERSPWGLQTNMGPRYGEHILPPGRTRWPGHKGRTAKNGVGFGGLVGIFRSLWSLSSTQRDYKSFSLGRHIVCLPWHIKPCFADAVLGST